MENIIAVWRDNKIKKVELSEEKEKELFIGVHTFRLDEKLTELMELKDGYYVIDGLEQYFLVTSHEVPELNSKWRKISLPFERFGESVIVKYLDELYVREYQEIEAEIFAEINAFKQDMDNELVFVDGVAKMKKYYHKDLEVKLYTDMDMELYVNGIAEVDIYFNEDDNKYSAYDGVDGYGWHSTIKEAVKAYMDYNYSYKNPLGDEDDCYEPSCSNCGDGGCVHCQPHRFL